MKDKIIVITGASEGLGKAAAAKLAQEGAKLVLVARNEEKLKQVSEQMGENTRYYVCDVGVPAQVREVASKILDEYESIDILINCAGIWTDEELEKNDADRRKRVLEVNTLGTIEFIKAFEPSLRANNKGHVLNVISTSGNFDTSSGDNTLWQTYGASKWALSGFTRAFKDSLEGTRVKVTGFYPGGFDSNLYENANVPDAHNQPWMMKTDDVADALIFCLTRPDDMLVEKLIVTKFGADS
ncbi:SDR family NAD(P)-dependent oxidoreductase [Candidatus Saccharibacteria bacterium]|nr:MAG: SDR family NAD(P)-dependent oxidoreductase [Candidatus Saccharibacteria bacterium]